MIAIGRFSIALYYSVRKIKIFFFFFSARRTKVIDDECDYYQTNSVWLSNSEREKLERHENEMRARKHGSRLNRKITFDFAGREVVDEAAFVDEADDEVLRSIMESRSSDTTMSSNMCPAMEFSQPLVRRDIYL